jgi:long-subunit fatty acid transport protein
VIFAFEKLRIGLNLQLPFWIRSTGKVNSRLPTDPFFSNAQVHGDAVSFDFEFPLMLRGGVEWRARPWLRLELDLDYEAWSMQKELRITPHNVYISGVPGVGTYYLHQTNIVRGLHDTVGIFLGAEILAIKMTSGGQYVRLGWALETDATPNETASVLTADGLRNYLCVGIGLKVGPIRLDGGYAHVFFNDRSVDYSTSRALQLNPIQPSLAVGVGGGKYYTSADILTAGLEAHW